ncbi:hypothetical protein ACJU26_05875 [Acidithiobacillus sp. M4-SHS-6]|uniref:hypothetical protein n=1 Tax=Acidithiobacillus sp. M4-SHS-6 TaxID=3383024 RepID=UPI0039BE1597
MAIEPLDFLDSAKSCIMSGKEMDWRNASSRAYYAAYHQSARMANSLCRLHPRCNEKKGSHERLICHINYSGIDRLKVIARLLDQCKTRRVIADYEIDNNFNKGVAEMQCYEVDRIFKKISHIMADFEAKASKDGKI